MPGWKEYRYTIEINLVRVKIIFCWNCHRAKSKDFIREMREVGRIYSPMLTIILEPKIDGDQADEIYRSLGKSGWIRSEAWGFSGGVWLLWNEDASTAFICK